MKFLPIHQLRRVKGFTMVELMGAVTIALLLIIMLYSIFSKVQNIFVTGQNRTIAMDEARTAMDMLVDDFKILNLIGDVKGDEPNLRWMPAVEISAASYPLPLSNPRANNWSLITNSTKVTYYNENYNARFITKARIELSDGNFTAHVGPKPSVPAPSGSKLYLYHHDCRFFTFNGAWKMVHYKFGPRERYFMPHYDVKSRMILKDPEKLGGMVDLVDSPVGALWVYRSPSSSKGGFDGGLGQQLVDHENLQKMEIPLRWDLGITYSKGDKVLDWIDKSSYQYINKTPASKVAPWLDTSGLHWAKLNTGGLDSPMGFARLVDGVIHFRVRAADPRNPERDLREYTDRNNPFTGYHLPTHVIVEMAVLDRKLLREIESGMEQQLEDIQLTQKEKDFINSAWNTKIDRDRQTQLRLAAEKYRLRLEEINKEKNLDRIYFFKQLVKVRNREGAE